MKSGLNPVERDHRDYDYHRTFGSVSPFVLPTEYDVDAGLTMPNQELDGLPYGCTGYAQTDLCTDEDGVVYDPRFTYDMTLKDEGQWGNYNTGCDIRDSLKTLLSYGAKIKDNPNDDPTTHRRGAYFNVGPTTDFFEGVRSAMYLSRLEKRAASIGTPWFVEFERITADGILPDNPTINTNAEWHNWVCSGWVMKQGEPYLKVKSWQGTAYGDNGWAYMSRSLYNKLLSMPYTGAFTVRKVLPEDIRTIKRTLMETLIVYLQRLLAMLQK